MEIKVLGTGCAGCKALFETVKLAVEELNIQATVVKEEDMIKIMSFNIMRLPGLVIDGKVISSGKKYSLQEMKELLTK
ncbi:MAG: thioredoxin family protein [Bacteroidales bacterium]